LIVRLNYGIITMRLFGVLADHAQPPLSKCGCQLLFASTVIKLVLYQCVPAESTTGSCSSEHLHYTVQPHIFNHSFASAPLREVSM